MSTEIQELEENMKRAKALIGTYDALKRLENNPDFKAVVIAGYLNDEAVRLVHLRGDENMQDDERQRSILTKIDAIGSFASYLQTIRIKAGMARRALDSDQETLTELMQERAE